MRKLTAAALAAASIALVTVAAPAEADDTVATFTLTAPGNLGISVPVGTTGSPKDLGSTAAGNLTFAPQLGAVTVTDSRAALVANWTATASGTNFDLQTAGASPATDANQRVAKAAVTYSAVPTVSVGTGVATPTAGTFAVGASVAYVGTGSNTVTWNPTLTMVLLPTQVAGTYKGTVTHSVS